MRNDSSDILTPRSVLNYRKPLFWLFLTAVILCLGVGVYFLVRPTKEAADLPRYLQSSHRNDPLRSITVEHNGTAHTITSNTAVKEILSFLNNVEIHRSSAAEQDLNRTPAHIITLQFDGLNEYYFFNEDCTSVWSRDGILAPQTHRVSAPAAAKQFFTEQMEALLIPSSPPDDIPLGAADYLLRLKSIYPQYFGLDTSMGLTLYIWMTDDFCYWCGLLSSCDAPYSDEVLQSLVPTTFSEMRQILNSYPVSREDITIARLPASPTGYPYHSKYDIEDWEWTFWSSDSPTPGFLDYVDDVLLFDIDGDGVQERCAITHGPTSMVFSFCIVALEEDYPNGDIKYFNIFSMYNPFTIMFEADDGKIRLRAVNEERSDIVYYFDIGVADGNITLTGDGKEVEYWGDQGPDSFFWPDYVYLDYHNCYHRYREYK